MTDAGSWAQLAQSYGLSTLLGVLGGIVVVALVICVAAHWLAEPGKPVTLLYGLASYTKSSRAAKSQAPPVAKPARASRPIDVYHRDTLWRIARPLEEWIDRDLTDVGPSCLDALLDGPYHRACKFQLSYFDMGRGYPSWRIHRECPSCGKPILPERTPDDRLTYKEAVIRLLKQVSMSGREIKSGLDLVTDAARPSA